MRAYAAHRDRLLVGEGLPIDPTAEWRLAGRDLECVAAHPEVPERAVVGTFESGLYRTTDGGETFEPAGEGIEQEAVTSAAFSPHDPDVVWAGTEPSRLYRSADGGETFAEVGSIADLPTESQWSFPPRPHTHHVRWIEPDPHERGRLYVGVEAGALLVTDDGGETWTERPPGSRRDNHTLATHPEAEGRVYSAAGDGYAESTDGGETWHHHQAGLDHRYVWSVAADPADPDRVLVSSATGAGSAHRPPGESYLYRREGGEPADEAQADDRDDARWERVEDPVLPTGEGVLRSVLATTGEAGEAYALNDLGLYRTPNFGDAWERVALEWPAALEGQTARGLAVVPA